MSDALNYLIAARPDAIVPYFKFLKEAGKNLDIRTRDLISVITKVDAQTEAGFRQYLSRALRNGASPNEVLDALPVQSTGLVEIYRAPPQVRVYTPQWMLAQAQAGRTRVLPAIMGCWSTGTARSRRRPRHDILGS